MVERGLCGYAHPPCHGAERFGHLGVGPYETRDSFAGHGTVPGVLRG